MTKSSLKVDSNLICKPPNWVERLQEFFELQPKNTEKPNSIRMKCLLCETLQQRTSNSAVNIKGKELNKDGEVDAKTVDNPATIITDRFSSGFTKHLQVSILF